MKLIYNIARRIAGKPLPKPTAMIAEAAEADTYVVAGKYIVGGTDFHRRSAMLDVCAFLAVELDDPKTALDIMRYFQLPVSDLFEQFDVCSDFDGGYYPPGVTKKAISGIKRRLTKRERSELAAGI